MSNRERESGSARSSSALRLLLRGGIFLGVLVAVFQAATFGPILPDPMVARFAWDGTGVAGAAAGTFLWTHVAIVAASALVFVGVPLALRVAAWWRADDDPQRAARFGEFEQWTLLFGLVTTTFTIAVVHFVSIANLEHPVHLGRSFTVLLATYLLFAITWTARLVRRFRRTAPAPSVASA